MDKNKISEMSKKMETKKDLLLLLNRIKHDEMEEMGMADKFHPFTMRHINYYCHPNHVFHRFCQFKIKKKNGGLRLITTPRNKSYMLILSCLNEMFKALYTPSNYAMGFTDGRSVVTNADKHKGMNYVLNLDLKDFFPSIEQPRIWKRLQLKPFDFPVAITNVIAGLVCMKETREMSDGTQKDYYVLPQGSPTSPIITNMICDKLDRRLGGLAKRFGLKFTRYADDITFSSMHNVYAKDGEFMNELYRIIADQGFTVNEKKTRLQKLGSRQEVTGIIVSDKLNVTQKYVRDIRNILYIWDRYGYGVAYSKFFSNYKQEKGHVKKGNPDLINVLDGKLMYLKMVKGDKDSVYTRLHDKFNKLVDATSDSEKMTQQKKKSNKVTEPPVVAVDDSNKVFDDSQLYHRHGLNAQYISPHFLRKFLISYNQDPILKYTCHLIDDDETINNICQQCNVETYSFEKHYSLIVKAFNQFKDKSSDSITNKMFSLISSYLGISKKYETWSSSKVKYNWQSPELISWAKANQGKVLYPGQNIAAKQECNGFTLPNRFRSKLTGKRIITFSDLILFFKCQFHIRRDNDLRSMFKFKDDQEVGLKFSEDKYFDNIELFTDVDKVVQAFNNIIRICKDARTDKGNNVLINIMFYQENDHTYLVIHHTNTTYGKSANDAIKRIGESQSNLIKNQINGLCDLFIEADFGQNKYARINLWDEQEEMVITDIEPLQGVKYILRF